MEGRASPRRHRGRVTVKGSLLTGSVHLGERDGTLAPDEVRQLRPVLAPLLPLPGQSGSATDLLRFWGDSQ